MLYSMWANYRRASYFSAGNTTTSRIELNWSLLKRLLGTTTSVDTMVASLLRHQVTVIDQVVVEIQRHGLRSRPPPTIPDFLRRISAHMSNYCLPIHTYSHVTMLHGHALVHSTHRNIYHVSILCLLLAKGMVLRNFLLLR
ncbi:Hypothetical protein PHPALM_3244 [Phytophthora palmivora]|uniref:Uncharacterized protein n=1 Tax=Phytophthora palmivora TaxID=4796 RepID=A0A2P4YMX2_9STRA|nr:Hypothetical protein PHPALM_3244 [Phytophthora palmivora]